MASRQFGVDVAAWQSTDVSPARRCGAKFVIVKGTEGTNYINPKARAQVRSTHANKMYLHYYHFATFGSNVSRAKAEAKFAVAEAKRLNISKKRYIWLDWETGDGNIVINGKWASTRAIIAFMDIVHKAGYKAGFYSGASIMRNNVDTAKIVKKYGTCLWVASYATMGRIDRPNFGYFPSMNGVAIWQFTDNWCGLGMDGNISLIDLQKTCRKKPVKSTVKKESAHKPAENLQKRAKKVAVVYAPIINHNPNWKIALRDSKGKLTGKFIRTNTSWKVWDCKVLRGRKCYKIGNNKQWVPAQYVKVTKYK